MKNNITYSIIIPCFKTNILFFDECIQSVLKQTYSNFECLIICSDGSVNANNLPDDRRFKLINCETHSVGYKRNLGIKQAQGDYIVFLDCDDLMHEDYLSFSNSIIRADENVDIIYYCVTSKIENFLNNEFSFEKQSVENIKQLFIDKFLCKDDALLPKWVFSGNPAKVYRKEFILKNNLAIKEDFGLVGEDKIFNLECALLKPVAYTSDNCLYFYRINTGSLYRSNHNRDSLNWLSTYLSYSYGILSSEECGGKYIDKFTWYYFFYWLPKFFRSGGKKKHIPFKERYNLVKNTLKRKSFLCKEFKKHSVKNSYNKNKKQKLIFFIGIVLINLRFLFSLTLLISIYSSLSVNKLKQTKN
ncbi:MAG: glycosyltransferase [Bacteroidales bacterium]|nr:glycosyltransferase [Bacteroidales bacterium]